MAKRKYVMRLDIRDVICATRNMNWEQRGIYLELLTAYAGGMEIPVSFVYAKSMIGGPPASEANLMVALAAFETVPHDDADDDEAYGDRIFDARIEPLFKANRECAW
jgi:hypothetical protein